jgi:putative ABC transport system ATP-binding protein
MSLVEFKNVGKVYQSGEVKIRALENVNFEINEGEFCIIVGASGAGKTTILNILGGMDTLSSGNVTFDGKDISALSKREMTSYRRFDVGFVFQFYNLVGNLTAKENVELAAQICKEPLDAATVLEEVGLGDRTKNFPAQLSGGEQQRVALARALVNRPDILLADEPTGNLDPKNSEEIMRLLEEINMRGTTVLVVTHNREIVNQMKKRVIRLRKGVIISDEREGVYVED